MSEASGDAIPQSGIDTSIGTFCTSLGCRNRAAVVIEHPEHGDRPVCPDHENGYPVVENLEGNHVQ